VSVHPNGVAPESPGSAESAARAQARPGALRSAVLGVRLLTEFALLAVLALVGANATSGLAARIALAVLLPLAAAAIWGIGIAPRARRRWPDPWRIGAEIVLFLAAAAGLAAEGSVVAAVAFAVITIGTAAAVRVVATGG
jgi:Protein of unknown function (DUF2568)